MPALEWQKSSFSSGNADSDCVEVAGGPGPTCHLRESDEPSVVVTGTQVSLGALLTHLKAGPLGH